MDDDVSILISLEEILKIEGYNVNCFRDPKILLRHFKPFQYDLLLTDIKMGEISGFKLAENIKKIDPKIKICFFSAFKNYFDSLAIDNPSLDFKYFLQKPIRRQDLIYKIKEILG